VFADLRELDGGRELAADLCIVGAGAAGIALARRLAGSPLDLLLLESGGFEFESETQELYRGEVSGESYYDLRLPRVRAFGGSTHHWTGHLGRLRAADLEARPWDPWSGWPLAIAELDAYYDPALEVVRGRSWEIGPEPLAPATAASPDAAGRLELRYRGASPTGPVRFGEAYRDELRAAPNVRVLLHANLIALDTDPAGRTVLRARVGSLDGRRATVRARAFVLACGGLENPRLLLASNAVDPRGVGNRSGLVGRCFQEHPVRRVGQLIGGTAGLAALERRSGVAGSRHRDLCPAAGLARRERLLEFGAQLDPVSTRPWNLAASRRRAGESDAAADLATVLPWFVAPIDPPPTPDGPAPGVMRRLSVEIMQEQQARPDNAVTLGEERDALGVPRLRLALGFGEADDRTLAAAIDALAAELGRRGLGRLFLTPVADDERPTRRFDWHGAAHHIGTTRMADDPARGVVDRDCRVHGVDNLWVAGSSVFPTAGYVNPTLTIVALALRLADHLRARLG
jgi:choline dehydrogenase-like flavoprotein